MMITISTILFGITIMCLCIASCGAICALHGNNAKCKIIARAFFYLAILFCAAAGVVRYYPFGLRDVITIARTMWGHLYLLVMLLILAQVYVDVSRWKKHWISITSVILPFATVVCLLSLFIFSSNRVMETNVTNHLLPFHIICAFVGELFFLLATAGSVIALYLNIQLKRKASLARVMSLPSLESIEAFNLWSSKMAFYFLSIGIAFGILLVWLTFKTILLFSFKELVMYVSWVAVFIVYLLRVKKITNVQMLSVVTIAAFIVMFVLFIASNFLKESGFHSFKAL